MVGSDQERSTEDPLRLSGEPFWTSLAIIKNVPPGGGQGGNNYGPRAGAGGSLGDTGFVSS